MGWRERWIGAGNREHHTAPVLELRESARRFGLVRKHRDLLVVTKLGRSLQTDPITQWWHVADRLPDARDEAEADAGMLLLVLAGSGAALNTAVLNRLLAAGLSALGWRAGGGAALDGWQAFAAARDTWTCLRRVGALPEEDLGAAPAPAPPAGIQFARAALLRPAR